MWANRIIDICLSVLSLFLMPVQLVTTSVLALLVTVTFGLLLIPLSLIWVVLFMGPLFALSWLWKRVPFLRIPVGCVGIPLAVVGGTYCCLIPTMGEFESRLSKMALCHTFPFTLDCWAFMSGKRLFSFDHPDDFGRVMLRLEGRWRILYKYLTDLPLRRHRIDERRGEPLKKDMP